MTTVAEAISLIDAVLGTPSAEQVARRHREDQQSLLRSLGLVPWAMGGIATKGCNKCGGTMWRTEEPGGGGQWGCGKCGAVE